MRTLIMAGGAGRRLGLGEKPLVSICGHPMISYVHTSCRDAGLLPCVVTSPYTPLTERWCREHSLEYYSAHGSGYVEDMIEAALARGEAGKILVIASDLPCVRSTHLTQIIKLCTDAGTDACSIWVPISLTPQTERSALYWESIDEIPCCPTGINMVTGAYLGMPQEEKRILIPDICLGINVNTPADRERAKEILVMRGRGDALRSWDTLTQSREAHMTSHSQGRTSTLPYIDRGSL